MDVSKSFFLLVILVLFQGLLLAQNVTNDEDWSNLPLSIDPGNSATSPSDAIILLGRNNLEEWVNKDGELPGWREKNGVMEIVPGTGDIFTKKAFGDAQLHVEWMIPVQDRGNGNSGVYLQGRYEVQIFNSYQNESEIYYNGQTGSLYKQHSPLVNASKPPGKWDSFDIVFTAPRFHKNGSLITPAVLTVFHNGVLVQYNSELKGTTTHENRTGYQSHALKQPLMIQDHGDRVLFRNIWIREL